MKQRASLKNVSKADIAKSLAINLVRKWGFAVVYIIGSVIEFILLGHVFSYGWNKFLTPIMASTIVFWQAMGVIILLRTVFPRADLPAVPKNDEGFYQRASNAKLGNITVLICVFVFLYIVRF